MLNFRCVSIYSFHCVTQSVNQTHQVLPPSNYPNLFRNVPKRPIQMYFIFALIHLCISYLLDILRFLTYDIFTSLVPDYPSSSLISHDPTGPFLSKSIILSGSKYHQQLLTYLALHVNSNHPLHSSVIPNHHGLPFTSVNHHWADFENWQTNESTKCHVLSTHHNLK